MQWRRIEDHHRRSNRLITSNDDESLDWKLIVLLMMTGISHFLKLLNFSYYNVVLSSPPSITTLPSALSLIYGGSSDSVVFNGIMVLVVAMTSRRELQLFSVVEKWRALAAAFLYPTTDVSRTVFTISFLLMATSTTGVLGTLSFGDATGVCISGNSSSPQSSEWKQLLPTCYQVVDYDFYIAPDSDSSILDAMARAELSAQSLSILPTSCKAALKSAVCSFVYPPCSSPLSAWSWNNQTTWIQITAATAASSSSSSSSSAAATTARYVPFKPLCGSVCSSLQSSCYGLISSFVDIGPVTRALSNCSSRANYSSEAGPWSWLSSSASLSSSTSSRADGSIVYVGLDRAYSHNWPMTFVSSSYDELEGSVAVCNSASSSLSSLAVAEAKEVYLMSSNLNDGDSGGGACAGVVSQLYVPVNPSLIGSSEPPMQEPFALQQSVEIELQDILSTLPIWLSSQCDASLRKYLCASRMLAPQAVNMSVYTDYAGRSYVVQSGNVPLSASKVTLQYTTYIPSYPDYAVCAEYVSNCGSFVRTWRSNSSALALPDCSNDHIVFTSKTGSQLTVRKFPDSSSSSSTSSSNTGSSSGSSTKRRSVTTTTAQQHQQVLAVWQGVYSPTSSAASVVVLKANLSSSPNTLSGVSDSSLQAMWVTECPDRFVVPDDPYSTRNSWVEGTGCAEPCRGSWNLNQLVDYDALWGPISGFLLLLSHIWFWASDKKFLKRSYLVIAQASLTCINTFVVLLSRFDKDIYCYNNAVPRLQSDGMSLCTVQGALMTYTTLASMFAWCLLNLELYRNIVMEKKLLVDRFYFNMFIIFLLPWAVIGYYLTINGFGYRVGFSPFCSASSEVGIVGALVFFGPLVIATLGGLYLLVMVILKAFLVLDKSFVLKPFRGPQATASITPLQLQQERQQPQVLAMGTAATGEGNAPPGTMENRNIEEAEGLPPGTVNSSAQQQLGGSTTSALTQIILLSLDMILFNFVLVIWNLVVTVVTFYNDFIFSAAATASLDTWATCIFTLSSSRMVSDSVWQAQCGAVPSFYNPLSALKFAIFAQCSNALMMALIYLPRRAIRWVLGPKPKTVIRRRWLVPDTMRIMKRESLVDWFFFDRSMATKLRTGGGGAIGGGVIDGAGVAVVEGVSIVPAAVGEIRGGDKLDHGSNNQQPQSGGAQGTGTSAAAPNSGYSVITGGRHQRTIDSMPVLHYPGYATGTSPNSRCNNNILMPDSSSDADDSRPVLLPAPPGRLI